MKISFIGCGYVGLVNALVLAHKNKKHDFVCFDVNNDKIKKLIKKESPFFEPKIDELIQKNYNIQYTSIAREAYENVDVIFICVATPENDEGEWNLLDLYKVIDDIHSYNCKPIIVIKSTVPIGTCEEINKYIKNKYNINPIIVNNPEFLAQGSAIDDCMKPNRIIFGFDGNKKRIQKFLGLFNNFKCKKFIISTKASEMSKVSANNFLALKLSFFNEMSNICRHNNISVFDVIETMKCDIRIGSKYMDPGLGYGGSCLPKDSISLYNWSKKRGYEPKLIKAGIDLNKEQKNIIFQFIENINKNDMITILGLSFKNKTGDIRYSISIDVIKSLQRKGYNNIHAYDKYAIQNAKKIINNIKFHNNMSNWINNSKIIIIMTDCDDFMKLKNIIKNPEQIKIINTHKRNFIKNEIKINF